MKRHGDPKTNHHAPPETATRLLNAADAMRDRRCGAPLICRSRSGRARSAPASGSATDGTCPSQTVTQRRCCPRSRAARSASTAPRRPRARPDVRDRDHARRGDPPGPPRDRSGARAPLGGTRREEHRARARARRRRARRSCSQDDARRSRARGPGRARRAGAADPHLAALRQRDARRPARREGDGARARASEGRPHDRRRPRSHAAKVKRTAVATATAPHASRAFATARPDASTRRRRRDGESYLSAMAADLRGLRADARPGGYLVLVTKNMRAGGALRNIAGDTTPLCQHAGLVVPAAHHRAARGPPRRRAAAAALLFGSSLNVRHALARGERTHLVCHEDVLVFQARTRPATKR